MGIAPLPGKAMISCGPKKFFEEVHQQKCFALRILDQCKNIKGPACPISISKLRSMVCKKKFLDDFFNAA